MWPEIIPLLAEYAIPTIQGLTAAGQKLSETGDPLKALLAGGGTAAGSVLGGKALGAIGGNVSRMAGGGDPATLSGKLYNAVEAAAQPVGQFLGQSWGANLGSGIAGGVSNVVPSVGSVANTALGGAGAVSNAMRPRPTGNVSAYQPPDISQYGANSQYGLLPTMNPLNSPNASIQFNIQQARAQDEINKILTPYAREQARQAYGEELQRQAASYQQRSGLDTAAAMLKQAQYGGQQAGINAQQAINNAISGPQRSYF